MRIWGKIPMKILSFARLRIDPIGLEIGSFAFISICFSYKGKATESLSEMRYSRFLEMLTKCSKIEPYELPPTERVAYYHALRVHLDDSRFTLLRSSKVGLETYLEPPAECLLNFIWSNFQTSTKSPWKGLTCSCRNKDWNVLLHVEPVRFSMTIEPLCLFMLVVPVRFAMSVKPVCFSMLV